MIATNTPFKRPIRTATTIAMRIPANTGIPL